MSAYAWTLGNANRFELRLIPNLRTFVGPYTPTTQVLDFLGERWAARVDLPPTTDDIVAAAREAFFDRLKGMANQVTIGHLQKSAPQGTMRGAPTLNGAVAQLANTCAITTTAGATLLAGDMLGINGQLIRVMANATADGTGAMTIEFQPRARVAWTTGLPVVWSAPTANFMLKTPDAPPTVWVPGYVEGCSFELIEAL